MGSSEKKIESFVPNEKQKKNIMWAKIKGACTYTFIRIRYSFLHYDKITKNLFCFGLMFLHPNYPQLPIKF